MNAYFRLIISQTGTAIELIPQTNGGSPLSIDEIAAYLQLKGIADYDIKPIYQAIGKLKDKPVQIPLCGMRSYQENEVCFFRMAEDKMTVTARFIAPSNAGSLMSKDEILKDLYARQVRFGIDEAAVDAFLKNRTYCTDIVVARGKEPRHGENAWIEYFFETDLQAKPTRREDGSVDFFNLNTMNHCKKGDLLARLHPEDKGEEGCNVLGERLRPREVKHLSLRYGRNITISEDRLELYSDINGHVVLSGDQVFVSDIYEVENVGPATGNITSEGSVIVNGNVQAGFSITAKENVQVKGVVEGAVIQAGGDIIIERGMNGMGRGKLLAGGRVIAKFVENAEIEAGTYVEADSLMHSRVSAKTEITVDGRKGFIAGGIVRATEKVACKTLGSELGADTVVEVGVNPEQKARFVVLQKEIVELQKKYTTVKTTLTGAAAKIKSGVKLSPEQMKYVQTLLAASQQMEKQLADDNAEFDELEGMLGQKTEACVCVRDTAYPGTKVVIGDDSMTLKSKVQFCRFALVGGEVKYTSL